MFLSRPKLGFRLPQCRVVEQLLQYARCVVLKSRQQLALQSGEVADALSGQLA